MRALVTGATGLVGAALVEHLRDNGWQVRALVRDSRAAHWVGALGADLAVGDILDPPAVAQAAAGCDVVFHAAATVTGGGSWEAYRRANIDGTRAAIGAASGAGARLLHVSSVAVFGRARYANAGRPVDETTPFAPLAERDFYGRSKRESETLVLAAHAAGELWAVAVRPCVVYGRRDRQFVPRFARLVRSGVVPLVGGGAQRFAIVHAANVAQAAVRAATSEAAGGRAYVTANDADISYAAFARLAASTLDETIRLVPVPYRVAAAGAAVARGIALLTGHPDLAGRLGSALDFIARDNPFSSALARRELGWTPTVTPEDGVREAFEWWKGSV